MWLEILAFLVIAVLFGVVSSHILVFGRRGRRWGQMSDSPTSEVGKLSGRRKDL